MKKKSKKKSIHAQATQVVQYKNKIFNNKLILKLFVNFNLVIVTKVLKQSNYNKGMNGESRISVFLKFCGIFIFVYIYFLGHISLFCIPNPHLHV